MPIHRDRSDLPRPADLAACPPVPTPEILGPLLHGWFDQYLADGNATRAKAIPGTMFRASWAGARCDRALYYRMSDTPESEPLTIADAWRFNLGNAVHLYLQEMLPTLFPHSDVEVPVDLRPLGVDGSATVDIVTYTDDSRSSVDAVVEIKSINGFGFKKCATNFRGPATGPKHNAVVQGSLAAAALQARRLIVVYVSLENLSPNQALTYLNVDDDIGKFAAEWHYTADEVAALAAAEVARVNRVARYLTHADGVLPPRALHDPEVPTGAIITDPAHQSGAWQVTDATSVIDAGTTWHCGYCNFRSRCLTDGPGGQPADTLTPF